MAENKSILIRVYGIVQGVGFRPFVKRTADRLGISGTVCNKGPYVEIEASGREDDLDAFEDEIRYRPPERAVILKMDITSFDPGDKNISPGGEEESANTIRQKGNVNILSSGDAFEIIESEKEEGEIFVSPDIAICPKCKEELFDPNNRRYLHPFINCTACGPRMTILDGMPYDRERTSMKEFPMCPDCEYEYTHPETRRYDAQPVCCNDCGPQVYLIDPKGNTSLPVNVKKLDKSQKDAAAITAARRMISDGGIVAVKGIGGFHLCCDATSEEAVMRLRRLKRRPAKPFAVMMKDMETVRRECELLPGQEEILDGHQKPIILLGKKNYYETHQCGKKPEVLPPPEDISEKHDKCGQFLCEAVAPDNPAVGVMMPYAPLQLLLFTYDDDVKMPDCLVMTSANVSGAPICRDDEDAAAELKDICDLILSHNRLIRLRADDSVMDFYQGKPYMIRRSRGYAPLPFLIENECNGTVLAVGGELKNTFCITKHHLFYPSPYVGDMADLRTVKALEESVSRMEHLLEAEPEMIVCDLHPEYNTTSVAKAYSEKKGIPLLQVQHHWAHILSCTAENEYFDPVIGVSFDGTGYGTDGSVWGGEFLLADCGGFRRLGSIRPFLQPGGDASAKEGWRIAVSMLYSLLKDPERTAHVVKKLNLCDDRTMRVQFMMHDKGINSVTSTSAGRLFDAVSAVLGIRRSSSFEGEASTTLMFRAQEWERTDEAFRGDTEKTEEAAEDQTKHMIPKLMPSEDNADGRAFLIRTDSLFLEIVKRRLAGDDIRKLAWQFHKLLSDMVAAGCEYARSLTRTNTVALSGGVFQNHLLTQMTQNALEQKGFRVLLHSMIPPNDGGIALGQALAGVYSISPHQAAKGTCSAAE